MLNLLSTRNIGNNITKNNIMSGDISTFSPSPLPKVESTPTPTPVTEDKGEVKGESDTSDVSTSDAVETMSVLGGMGWLGYKGVRKLIAKLVS